MNCKDCIHVKVCKISDTLGEAQSNAECCPHFADRSLFKKLPCELGATVYYFNHVGVIYSQKVSGFVINYVGILIDSDVMFDSHLFGKLFFHTREEAEQALSKRTQKKENEFYRGHI